MKANAADLERTLRGDVEHVARLAWAGIAREPLLAVGLAAGLGFALGGGLSRRILLAVAAAGARTAAELATNGVLSRTRTARAENERGDDDDEF